MAEGIALLEEVKKAGLSAWDAAPFLEKLTEIAPSIIYVFNQQTMSNEYSNRSLGASMGYSAEEILEMGQDLMPLVCHPDDLPRIYAYFEDLREMDDGEVSQIEYRMRHKDGGWAWLLSYDTVFERDASGAVLRHIGVAADITLQKQAEMRARDEKRAADLANEELRSFAYSVSHDMKSPSNTLQLLLTELRQEHGRDLDKDARHLIDLCLETVVRNQSLIEEVLNYTRVVGQEVAFSQVPLGPLISDICDDLKADITVSGAEIETARLPTVRGNPMQMRILFQNLISNALKFRQSSVAPVIRIHQPSHLSDEHVAISVTDNGIGIAPRNQERIFGMFERLHLNEEFAGSGLGLAICKRIATNHGGEITVKSAPNSGTTFTVLLPRT